MLFAPSPCTSRTAANLLTVSSREPSGYATTFALKRKKKNQCASAAVGVSYRMRLNINYSVTAQVERIGK